MNVSLDKFFVKTTSKWLISLLISWLFSHEQVLSYSGQKHFGLCALNPQESPKRPASPPRTQISILLFISFSPIFKVSTSPL